MHWLHAHSRCEAGSSDTLPDLQSCSSAEEDSDDDIDDAQRAKVCLDDLMGSEHQPPDRSTSPAASVQHEPDLPDDLPTDPGPAWMPDKTVDEWAACMWAAFPAPLRRWIERHEPSMQVSWVSMVQERKVALPVLSYLARKFEPVERKAAIKGLFKRHKLFEPSDLELYDSLFCGFPDDFGHIQFRIDDDTTSVRAVLGIADCFFSLIDDAGMPEQVIWDPLPRVEDPPDFKAGGLHTPEARRYWREHMQHASKWVKHWI